VGEFVAVKGKTFPSISEEDRKKLVISIDGEYQWNRPGDDGKTVTDSVKIATSRLHEGQVNSYFPVSLRALILSRLNLEPPFDRAGNETSNQFIVDPFTGVMMIRTASRTFLGGWKVNQLDLTFMGDGRGIASEPMKLRSYVRPK